MLPPALAICNNWAAVPLPPHIADLKPTRAELIVTAKGQVGALYAVTGKNMMHSDDDGPTEKQVSIVVAMI